MLGVEVTPRAAVQIERAARWWAENRPAARAAIADEFEQAKTLLNRKRNGMRCFGIISVSPKRRMPLRAGYLL